MGLSVKEKFEVNIDSLRSLDISILKNTLKVGREHLKYFNETMGVFKFPEKRMKCHDTVYYERVVPEIELILKEYEKRK